jgi:putative FmdB family regulatory protein
MPIYDYKCKGCGKGFELLVLKGTALVCPGCKSKKIEQQVSTFAVASMDMTVANVAKARKSYQTSSEAKEKKVAEADAIRHHNDH